MHAPVRSRCGCAPTPAARAVGHAPRARRQVNVDTLVPETCWLRNTGGAPLTVEAVSANANTAAWASVHVGGLDGGAEGPWRIAPDSALVRAVSVEPCQLSPCQLSRVS